MDLVPDDENEGFSFIWTIENFSYCLQKKGEFLSSPRFKFNFSDAKEWSLHIFPRGDEIDNCIAVYLDYYSGPCPLTVNKYISIRTTNGTYRRKNTAPSVVYELEGVQGFPCFLNHSDLFKKGEDAFLEKDTLTLRCRIIWTDDSELPVTGQCCARTVMDVKRINFVWNLGNFETLLNGRKTKNFFTNLCYNQSFTVCIFLSEGIYNERTIRAEIQQDKPYKKRFVTCKLSLMDANRKITHSVHDEHWFEAEQEKKNWSFPFMLLKKVLDNEKLFLVNGKLSLYYELTISTGVKYSEMEKTQYDVAEEHDGACSTKSVEASFHGSWKDNLQSFYKEGKFSDVTIRTTSNKEFPVHKAILCARSEVFSAMFEHDTKENQTGFVEIEDLNDDTVSRMLLFIYTDIVEDLTWQTASELYFAADKYAIVALKRECSTFLKSNLNCSNVCEVLVMADKHQDQDMKSAAQDFVMDHAAEIINSEYWKKFMHDVSNFNLATETMHLLCMRNLKI